MAVGTCRRNLESREIRRFRVTRLQIATIKTWTPAKRTAIQSTMNRALPLLLLPHLGVASHLFDHWLRDPFLRSRGTHPPSWPRRHLMLSVLRH